MTNILMCSPDYFDVSYEINPWMKVSNKVSKALMLSQWQQLKTTIEQCGATVSLIPPQQDVPDMVFTANAGFVFDRQVYIATFRHPERAAEREYFADWFAANGFKVHGLPAVKSQTVVPYFEGTGDLLMAGNTLFAAYGFRTDAQVYQHISQLLPEASVVMVELVDPRFYHLDTCFCPLNAKQALVWPGAFTAESYAKIQQAIDVIEVPEEDAFHFACNAVVIDQQVILPSGCDQTAARLQAEGWTVYQCELTEFLKAGGAAKCLTLEVCLSGH